MENNNRISKANMSTLVTQAFMESLFKDTEKPTSAILVEGIERHYAFHPQRLENQREIVKLLLNELPHQFKKGSTFLNFSTTRDGGSWTYSFMAAEQLLVLALGLDLVAYCVPREFWVLLPEGMPYIMIK